jgi:hypothetical protein
MQYRIIDSSSLLTQTSNYTQIGLAFNLYSAEVLFNKGELLPNLFFHKKNNFVLGLSLIYLGQVQEGMAELEDATRQQATEEHSVIDEAIRDRGEGYTVFSIVRLKRYLFPLQTDWICSPLVSSTVHRRTSSGTPRPAIFLVKPYVTPHGDYGRMTGLSIGP